MSAWVIDEVSAGWLAYFLTHRSHPMLPETGSAQYQAQLDSIVTVFLVSPPQCSFFFKTSHPYAVQNNGVAQVGWLYGFTVAFSPVLAQGAVQIACAIFDSVIWEQYVFIYIQILIIIFIGNASLTSWVFAHTT
jgi:hypothetical protein